MRKVFLASETPTSDVALLPPDDLLRGASAIAFFLLNDPGQRRVVYHLFEKKRLPAFRLGKRIYARKSTLSAWIEALEAETNAQSPNFNKPAAPC